MFKAFDPPVNVVIDSSSCSLSWASVSKRSKLLLFDASQLWQIAGVISNEVRRDYNEANDHRPTLGSFKSLLKLLTPDSSTGRVSKATHLCRCNFLPYWGFVWDGWVLNFAFLVSPLLSTWKFYVPKYIAFCWDTEISAFQGVLL